MVSRNPSLAKVRKAILEGAGFTVIAATDDKAVGRACSDGIESHFAWLFGHAIGQASRVGENHGNTATFPFWNCARAALLNY